MVDEGSKNNDKKISKVERKITAIYSDAQKDIEAKTADFFQKFEVKHDIKKRELEEGKITKKQYDSWYAGQMFQAQQWQAKQEEILSVIDNANKEAAGIVNRGMLDSFAGGANWQAYCIEKGVGASVGFSLYDRDSVARLIADNPDILPKWKIDEPKEYTWNKQKVQNAITQSIIQGETLEETSKRIATALGNNNKNLALTHAQTAMAGAQNAGRNVSLMRAKSIGINVVKEWMATLDKHTRDSHRDMDGERQKVGDAWHPMKFSNGCRFPGDPDGPAHEVFNCRCTLVGTVLDYPESYKRYDNIDGKPIESMSYREWEEAKKHEKIAVIEPVKEPSVEPSEEKIMMDRKAYSILSMYDSYDDMVDNLSEEDYAVLEPMLSGLYQRDIEELMAKVHNGQVQVTGDSGISHLKGIDDFWKTDSRKSKNYETILDYISSHCNVDEDEAAEMWDKFIKAVVDKSDVGMNIDGDALISVLTDGRFKNQFETGTSRGFLSFSSRTQCESEMFHTPTDISPMDRPIYGTLFPKIDNWDDEDPLTKMHYIHNNASGYGDCVVIFKRDKVIDNATLTLGDSLDDLPACGATSLADPKGVPTRPGYVRSVLLDDSVAYPEEHGKSIVTGLSDSCYYCEVQLHGVESHSIDNIQMVYVSRMDSNASRLVKMLESMGIPYQYM